MHAIEAELIKITGYKPQRKFSDRQDYLSSILNAVAKLTDDDFEELSDEAAAWANAAVEAKNSKDEEIPDFEDAVPTDDDEPEESDDEPEDDSDSAAAGGHDAGESEVEASSPGPDADEPEPAPKPKKEAKTKAAKPAGKPKQLELLPKEKKAAKKVPLGDATVDKWGCIEGSKNSQALALFERGATAREVKEELGGTYYNILAKCVREGHRLQKDGSLMTLVHKTEIGTKKTMEKVKKAK